jgi:serine/threonine protein kinase
MSEWEALEAQSLRQVSDALQAAAAEEDAEVGSYTSSASTTPTDGTNTGEATIGRATALPDASDRGSGSRGKKERLRTQSESAAWTRASLKMRPTPPGARDSYGGAGSGSGADTPAAGGASAPNSYVRNSEGALSRLTEDILSGLDFESERRSHDSLPGPARSFVNAASLASRERCINMWLEHGQISDRASEILEDAKLSMHGQEKNLYKSSARRLSEAQDPALHSLGEKMALASSASSERLGVPISEAVAVQNDLSSGDSHRSNSTAVNGEASTSAVSAKEATESSGTSTTSSESRAPLVVDNIPRATEYDVDDYFRPESATLYHEAVRWEGVLAKRSEWLRRLEKHYYVLEGKYLRRFASKEAYLASRDEPLLHQKEPLRADYMSPKATGRGSARRTLATPSPSSVSHLYILAGVKDSATRTNGFTFITEDKKTLQVAAPTAVEKVIWMRLGLEAIVALPNLPVAPLDMEEFYAMLVVLFTAYRGNWRTEGDMAVTLPPPSEQVFTRFFRLLDKDVIFCSNYPPSVPFHGSFRGHAGVVNFVHEFARNTLWTNFKIGGLSVEGSIAVASGKEELENRRDGRKFIQNWVHKFTFYSDGRLARFEINGDVVAASAVFKVPGAATTLKLPQEFNEVDAEHGLDGQLLVRVMQGNGLKLGATNRKSVKEPSVSLVLAHREKPLPKSETATTTSATGLSSISVPAALSRKFSSGIGFITATATGATSASSSTPGTDGSEVDPFSTGTPRNFSQASYTPTNPVWNKVIALPFKGIIGTCSLHIDVTDLAKNSSTADAKIGHTSVNIAKYIMSSRTDSTPEQEEAAMASDSRWYTISNAKGEYCGKIMLGISCRRKDLHANDKESDPLDGVGVQPRLKKSQSVVIDYQNPPSSHMLQWDATGLGAAAVYGANTPANNGFNSERAGVRSARGDEFVIDHRRHGWANVKLSPENIARTRSAGDVDEPVLKKFPESSSATSVVCKENEDMHTFMVCGAPFTIPRHYQLIKVCGRGAYGIVIAATNMLTGGNVAIKKVIDCIWHPHQLKQILRECRLIRHMAHENVLSLMDLIPPPSYADFRDVYMTIDLMEMDLHRIIYSKEVLLDDHIRYFLYQMLSGLSHMHKAGVLHRDLKPSNLLINSDCQLKICDLGLARSKEADDVGMTEYVVTRWYRAPELLLGSAYGEGVDLWAAGCIFAEMLGRKPLFPGETYVHQLQLIMNVLGVPEEHSFKENPLANKLKGRQLLSRTQAVAGIDTSTMFPNANPEGLDLLWKMLVFDVEKRITVQEALRHPYLAAYYDEERENAPVERFQSFDLDDLDESDLKELMFKEICHFHPEEMEKRAQQQHENPEGLEKLPPGWVKRESRSVPGKFYYSNPKRGISTWIKEEMD